MYRERLKSPTVETCRFRADARHDVGQEKARCRLLESLIGSSDARWCSVERNACEACCQSFPPSRAKINPVIASLLHGAALRILAMRCEGYDLGRIAELARSSIEQVGFARSVENTPAVPWREPACRLRQALPPPAQRHGRTVRRWAVGVTTAPRRESTLEACLESLARAGWARPYLFVDSVVRVPDRFEGLPGTFRDESVGAWPNYYLGLMELLLREPDADVYMMIQDDVVLFDRENLCAYLEEILWPGRSTPLVSLYASSADTQPGSGWYPRDGGWTSAPLRSFSRRNWPRRSSWIGRSLRTGGRPIRSAHVAWSI